MKKTVVLCILDGVGVNTNAKPVNGSLDKWCIIGNAKAAVFPLMKKNHAEKAMEIYNKLSKSFMTIYDETGNIGKRYRRQDAIGTPFCVTIDDETLNNNTVTVRERDTMKQEVVKLDELVSYIELMVKRMYSSSYDKMIRECIGYLNMLVRNYLPDKKKLRFKPVEIFREITNFIAIQR